jgi:hypothetical protein
MQFGRVFGIALIALGIILLALQAALYFSPNSVSPPVPPSAQSTTGRHVTSLPGIAGAGSLATGIAVYVTRRRRDEPEPKNAVK